MLRTLILTSKAQTLQELRNVIRNAEVLPLIRFSVSEYRSDKTDFLREIQSQFSGRVIVRSSSQGEDNEETSHAGGFDSVLDVPVDSASALDEAIEKVIASYLDPHDKDEVFVQPMLSDVEMSGVIFSADIDVLSPYYIINYDESGSTSSVTGGEASNLKTFVCFKENFQPADARLEALITATKECEQLFGNSALDIEFAYADGQLYILQVRGIVTHGKNDLSGVNLSESLRKLHKKIEKLNGPHPNLLGSRTIFGVMPDWNPAEIIGVRPKRLALSLYKELITDETWAYQRDNYGYRNLRSHPLLVSFLGVPFIDVRVSFNSFVPKSLEDTIAEKLVDYYLNALAQNKNHHDKVEFEIIYSCYYFGLPRHLDTLKHHGFTDDEIKTTENALRDLTNQVIDVSTGLYKKDLQKVELLKQKYHDVTASDLPLIDKIYWLIKDVKRYGTLPFAGVARAGFIAVQLLNSFVDEEIISRDEYNAYLNSLNTVSKHISADLATLDKECFLEKYGHLRPGTYDILSQRYDEGYEHYFAVRSDVCQETSDFDFSQEQQHKIEIMLEKHQLNSSYSELMMFIKEAIEGREYAKFVFTKSLSQVLRYIEEFGGKFGFSKEELAYLDIQKIMNLYATLDHRDVHDILLTDIRKNMEFYKYTQAVKLPNLIVDAEDIYRFYLDEGEPNFVTLKSIEAQVVREEEIAQHDVARKIVCIKSADPGYDYLFSKNIGGLITCYGGANSHMAIRCAENGIPAVIGCAAAAGLFPKH